MKVVLFVAFSLFCLLRTSGAQLQCLECDSQVSYDDCQNKSTMVNCSSDYACFQSDAKVAKGGAKTQELEKGCLNKSLCEAYNKGEIEDCILAKNSGYEVDCKAMCCHEDRCNMEDILVNKTGAQLQCLECDSQVSYDDCQNKSTMVYCSSDYACFQSDAKVAKGGAKTQEFEKGCLNKSLCEAYNKGEIEDCILAKNSGYEVDCKAMCCHEDWCNMEDILVNKTEPTVESTSSSTTGADEKDNKGSAFAISVMILLSGLLLTLVNIN